MKNFVFIVTALFLAGCASISGSSLSRLETGITQEETVKTIGAPAYVTGAKTGDSSNELWEYETRDETGAKQVTWLAFQDKKLSAWGRAGDFTNYSPKAVLNENFLSKEIMPFMPKQEPAAFSAPAQTPVVAVETPAAAMPLPQEQEKQEPAQKNFSP